MSEYRCSVCGNWFDSEVVHGCTGTPTFNPLDPLAATCEIESLRKKLDTALLQIEAVKKEAAEAQVLYQRVSDDDDETIDRLQASLKESDRLVGEQQKKIEALQMALKAFMDACPACSKDLQCGLHDGPMFSILKAIEKPDKTLMMKCEDCGEEHHRTFMPHHKLNCSEKRKCENGHGEYATCGRCERRKCEAEHAAGGVVCNLPAGHGGRHDSGQVSWFAFGEGA